MQQDTISPNILTRREFEIVRLVSQGFSSKEIGKVLNISIFTVESHRSNILKKLNLKKSTALVNYYFSHAHLFQH